MLARAPQPHVERALTAVFGVGLLQSGNIRPEFRQAKPERHLPLEDSATAAKFAAALPRNHQHDARAMVLRAM